MDEPPLTPPLPPLSPFTPPQPLTPVSPAAAQPITSPPEDPNQLRDRLAMLEKEKAELAATLGRNRLEQAREQYVREKMPNLPTIYHEKLGSDPAKWPDEEKAIRARYGEDLKKIGYTPSNSGSDGGGKAIVNAAGTVKTTAYQNILAGIRRASRPTMTETK